MLTLNSRDSNYLTNLLSIYLLLLIFRVEFAILRLYTIILTMNVGSEANNINLFPGIECVVYICNMAINQNGFTDIVTLFLEV